MLQLPQEEQAMDYEIELVEKEAMPTLSIRKTVSADNLRHEIGSAYAAIASHMSELGASEPGKPYVAYFNMDMEHLEVEMGFATDKEYPGFGDVSSAEVPGGQWVSIIHKGPYKEMGHAYTAAAQWMQEHGIEGHGSAYEHYLNDPAVVPESELLTKIEFFISS